MSTLTPRLGAGAAATLVLALLAGCSAGDQPADGADSGDRQPDLTAPGTALALGEPAQLPLKDDAGVVELTVSSISPSEPGDRKADGDAYYVKLTATVESGDGHAFAAEGYLSAWSGDERVMPLAAPVKVGSCSRAYFKADAQAGTMIEPCLTFVVPDGADPVDRVAFYAGDEYEIGEDTAVVWGS